MFSGHTNRLGAIPRGGGEIVKMLRSNVDLFAWKPSNMPRIDPNVVCHQLSLDSLSKVMAQKKRKKGEEKKGR